jgi:hypothetical protein
MVKESQDKGAQDSYAPGVVRPGMRVLPVFRGYTVDVRLCEFRKVPACGHGMDIEFLSFHSEEGDALLVEYIASCSPEDLDELCRYFP